MNRIKPKIKNICSKLSQKYTVLSLIKICPSLNTNLSIQFSYFHIYNSQSGIYTAWLSFWKHWQLHYQNSQFLTFFSCIPVGNERPLLESLTVNNLKTGNVQGISRNILSKHLTKFKSNQNKTIHHFKNSLIQFGTDLDYRSQKYSNICISVTNVNIS